MVSSVAIIVVRRRLRESSLGFGSSEVHRLYFARTWSAINGESFERSVVALPETGDHRSSPRWNACGEPGSLPSSTVRAAALSLLMGGLGHASSWAASMSAEFTDGR